MICFPPEGHPGHFPLESLPSGWVNERNSEKSRYEIIDLTNKLRYPQEPVGVIAWKCLGIFFFILPLYMTLYTIIHLIRLPVITYVHQSPSLFFKQVMTIVRIPFYWLALQFSALYGIFRPLDGRAWFAHFEKELHGGGERRDAANFREKLDVIQGCKDALTLEKDPPPYYAAICFQPYN